MIIACDVDGVVNNLYDELIKRYNFTMGTSLVLDDFTDYNFNNILPEENAKYMRDMLLQKDVWDSLELMQDAKWGIETLLKTNHTILFTTATDPRNFPWKVEWFEKHLPFVDTNNIIRVMNKGYIKSDIIIDDNLDQLKSNICERICFSYPWNVDETTDYIYDIYRCNSWREIINTINEIERKNG